MAVSVVMLALFGNGAAGQMDDAMGGYTAMEIEAGRLVGNFATGAIEEMSGGVRIRLLADDPSLAALPIQAEIMKFTWMEGRTTPSVIVMERGVRVTHPDAVISADRAEWDFDSGRLVFSGSPEVNSERLKGLRGEKMTLNMKTNTFEVTQVRADQVPLQAPETAAAAPQYGLRENEVNDWEQLLTAIKNEAADERPSPGRQIVGLLSEQNRHLLMQLDTAALVERRADVVRLINGVLASPEFYDASAWDGKTLPEEATRLLAEPERDARQQVTLNRLLFKAAYPFAFSNTEP